MARRTGLTAKTIRFSSERGIVTPTDRSRADYRLYGIVAEEASVASLLSAVRHRVPTRRPPCLERLCRGLLVSYLASPAPSRQ
ncbi:hypothetical protein G3I51_12190 [Streptomyces sp. SID9944]|nr:hypothetical protein [Streptomyces sp. SID9944]